MRINKISFGKKIPHVMNQSNSKQATKSHKLRNVLVASSVIIASAAIAAIAISKKKNMNLNTAVNTFKNKANSPVSSKSGSKLTDAATDAAKKQPVQSKQAVSPIIRPKGWRLNENEMKRIEALRYLHTFEQQEEMLKLRTSPGGVMVKTADLKDAFKANIEHVPQKQRELFFNFK